MFNKCKGGSNMFDYNSIVTDKELKLDFVEKIENVYSAIDKVSGIEVGSIVLKGYTFQASSDDVFIQYKLWLTRPERSVGKSVDLAGCTIEELSEQYEELLIGAYLLSSKLPVEIARTNYKAMIDWLRTTDFYTAPASTIHHESCPGGLLTHSLKVYNRALDLLNANVFNNISVADVAIAALTHDWCKIGFYESYLKNVKNEKTGLWDKETAYKRNPKGLTLGHGVTSMYLAGRCFNLSPEVAAAIRWHQGMFNCCREEIDELQRCNEKYPLVHLIQFADQLAITEYANK